jgi:hypothetical protein
MHHASYVTYTEITGQAATEADIRSLLQPIAIENALFFLCQINMHMRLLGNAVNTSFLQALANAQAFLFRNYIDEQLFDQIRQTMGRTTMHERVLFHPVQVLKVMRCALIYCRRAEKQTLPTDDQRHAIGRSCLMMNDLLAAMDENLAFAKGPEGVRRALLMAHFMSEFEVNNPGSQSSLINRSLAAFNLLISDAQEATT